MVQGTESLNSEPAFLTSFEKYPRSNPTPSSPSPSWTPNPEHEPGRQDPSAECAGDFDLALELLWGSLEARILSPHPAFTSEARGSQTRRLPLFSSPPPFLVPSAAPLWEQT